MHTIHAWIVLAHGCLQHQFRWPCCNGDALMARAVNIPCICIGCECQQANVVHVPPHRRKYLSKVFHLMMLGGCANQPASTAPESAPWMCAHRLIVLHAQQRQPHTCNSKAAGTLQLWLIACPLARLSPVCKHLPQSFTLRNGKQQGHRFRPAEQTYRTLEKLCLQ